MALARQLINAPHAVVVRAAAPPAPRVALLSGGGSGHEPLHTGFVGPGMLDAAVPGAVFASPNPAQIHAATAAVDQGRGVVHLVKNYTGDVLNFAIAAELAAADGIEVETVLVDDDLATDGGDVDGPGRRGTAAVIAVEKICGAAAEAGADLADVARLGPRVVSGAATLAVALSGCTHPGRREASFVLADDEVELGVGIHGERGTRRSPLSPVAELVAQLVDPVVAALGLETGEEVLAIVNGLGSTGYLELAVVFREVAQALDKREIAIARSLVGTYVTSLDMAGCSITLVRLDDELTRLWDAPVHTPALRW